MEVVAHTHRVESVADLPPSVGRDIFVVRRLLSRELVTSMPRLPTLTADTEARTYGVKPCPASLPV